MRRFVLALTIACPLLVGCRGTVHVHDPAPPPPPRSHGHVHDAHCGHYWHNGGWHHAQGHVHGPGCGHRWDGSRWIIIVH